jgi:hypothetical protein
MSNRPCALSLVGPATAGVVIAGLDPAIHPFRKKMDARVTALRMPTIE